MSGEMDLQRLLATMRPHVDERRFVFVTFPQGRYGDGAHLQPVGMFAEQEGMTLIIEDKQAEHNNLRYEGLFRCISLTVHSSLQAVGLTAAIASALAEQGISANVVAAYYHDHVFVQEAYLDKAIATLQKLSEQASQLSPNA